MNGLVRIICLRARLATYIPEHLDEKIALSIRPQTDCSRLSTWLRLWQQGLQSDQSATCQVASVGFTHDSYGVGR